MKKALIYFLELIVTPLVIVPVELGTIVNHTGKTYTGPGWPALTGIFLGMALVINGLLVLAIERKAPRDKKIRDILLGFPISLAGCLAGSLVYALFILWIAGHGTMETQGFLLV